MLSLLEILQTCIDAKDTSEALVKAVTTKYTELEDRVVNLEATVREQNRVIGKQGLTIRVLEKFAIAMLCEWSMF